jgi:hypothetical protein
LAVLQVVKVHSLRPPPVNLRTANRHPVMPRARGHMVCSCKLKLESGQKRLSTNLGFCTPVDRTVAAFSISSTSVEHIIDRGFRVDRSDTHTSAITARAL